MKPKPALGDF